eukprot:scpid81835/ scgid30566/ Ribonuclease P protein subunit p20; Ribonucleases P/MRP protein subunit POP7 homolog
MATSGEVPAAGAADETGPSLVREKRVPVKPSLRPCDLYVTRSSSFVSQLQRCRYLLAKGMSQVHVHAIGPAMVRAINLALTLVEESAGTLATSCTTSTVRLVDDMVPVDDESMPRSEVRANSAINIRVYKLDAETYMCQHGSEAAAAAEAEDDMGSADASPAAQDGGGKSKKRKRNRSAAPRAQTGTNGGGGGSDGKRPVDLQRARAVARETKAASEDVEKTPSQSAGPRRQRRR